MKIICIGRNYAAHAAELKNEVPSEPVFFCKPDSALLPKGQAFFMPEWTREVHYEVELVLRIGRLGKYIEPEFAHRYIDGIGLGIDFTARDIQDELKKKGLPWEKAKAFDGSAVISSHFVDATEIDLESPIEFELHRNGKVAQHGNSADLIFSFAQIIAHVSRYMTLKIGDFIFTGTPQGVGPVAADDVLEGFLQGQKMFRLRVK